jgi:orotidine-5'-phosphate decarboxylase
VDLAHEVERQGLIAAEAGLRGVVCSPQEVSLLRRRLGPDLYIVVPGVRRRSDPLGDQVRVATAKDAVNNGATHLVVGRPVLQAPEPAAAFEEFMREARCIGS